MRKCNYVVYSSAVLFACLVGLAGAETFTGELTQQEPKKTQSVKMDKGKVYQLSR